MFLQNLKLTNFRNFPAVDLDFAPTTLLVGDNAQGKSNLLESVYFLATTKSPRAQRDLQLIKEGEEFVRVEGEVGESQESRVKSQGKEAQSRLSTLATDDFTKLEIVMQRRPEEESLNVEKRVKVNGVVKRAIDYIGNLVVIHFSPEDINLVTGSPALRRYHLDLTLSQIDRHYKKALAEYLAALVARNRLLKRIKEGLAKISELDFWTENILKNGEIIAQKRRTFFDNINRNASLLSMSEGELGNFRFIYQESILNSERLAQYLGREVAAAITLIGPHRDDFLFAINGKNLAYFGSRGEQRTGVLELKLAELKFISKQQQTSPILLLDDVFSELDERHRQYMMEVIVGQQTILSAVETSHVPKEFLKSMKVVKIEKGEAVSVYESENGLKGGKADK